MKGFDIMDMLPGSVLEEMIRGNANDIVAFLLDLARNLQKWEPGEVPAYTLFVKPAENGKPETIGILVQALDNELTPTRTITWYDLRELLATAPIATWMQKGKQAKRLGTELEKLEAQRNAHFEKHGDDARHVLLKKAVDDMRMQMDELAKGVVVSATPQPVDQ